MTVGGKRFNKKITKHEKTVSLAECSALSISKLISTALNDGRISDTEFNLILREVEQYHSLNKGLRSSSTEGVDVDDKKRISKKALIPRKRKELNIQFSRRADGFSLFISRVVNN